MPARSQNTIDRSESVDWMSLLTDGVMVATGANLADSVSHAQIILEFLQREHGGLYVYVPVLPPSTVTSDDVDHIRKVAGISLDGACWRAGISRRTYYRRKQNAAPETGDACASSHKLGAV